MDVNKVLQELKARPGFTDHVGMMLVHNGVVRGWSRKDHAPVSSITVSHDQAKMDAICHEMEQRPGIFGSRESYFHSLSPKDFPVTQSGKTVMCGEKRSAHKRLS